MGRGGGIRADHKIRTGAASLGNHTLYIEESYHIGLIKLKKNELLRFEKNYVINNNNNDHLWVCSDNIILNILNRIVRCTPNI